MNYLEAAQEITDVIPDIQNELKKAEHKILTVSYRLSQTGLKI
ncbi:hypothetical protein [Chryseobacterium wanjuense]